MMIVGLTGSIATGKSFVADYFKQKEIKIFDADQQVHALLSQNIRIIEMIGRFFPGVIQEGKINREKLANTVFEDDNKLVQLEDIIHPFIEKEVLWFIEKMERQKTGMAILEVPLLFEKGWEKHCNYVIVTHCDSSTQKKRALARPNMTSEKFNAIIQKQMPDNVKKKRANFLIDTSGDKEATIEQIQKIETALIEKR